ncbi:MAG: bifunctional DNA-formamidopyrimidine glycosylase/DNA-(apurinic or apyrimidinic site) lyase [Microgenomates group bacterium]
MPELPEVETIKRVLERAIVGKTIKNIEVRKAKIFQGEPKEVVGRKIEGIERRGKMLIIRLSGNKALLVHLKLTGQLVWVGENSKFEIRNSKFIVLGHPIPFAGTELPARTTHVIFEIDGGKLFYNDLRQFGWIKVMSNLKSQMSNVIGDLGPEPFDKEFTTEYLRRIFSRTSKPIKLVLMDQTKIAGVGNIYANEALFEAGIMPTRSAKKLSNEEIKKLREAIIKVLEEGLKYGGSSAKDEAYVKPTGEPGEYQKHFRVYQREGEKCRRCGSIVKRINLGGRGTFWCPKCQK